MGLDILKEKGVALEKQQFTWRDMVQPPTSKQDDDAFTRVRILLMNGLESEAVRFSHACARMNREDDDLLPADLSPIETTIGFEQADVSAVASMGIMQALADPRTSMSQCLNAIATAELTDNAGWELLIDLADELGHEDLSERFIEALTNEQQHLLNVQTWLSDRIMAKL